MSVGVPKRARLGNADFGLFESEYGVEVEINLGASRSDVRVNIEVERREDLVGLRDAIDAFLQESWFV